MVQAVLLALLALPEAQVEAHPVLLAVREVGAVLLVPLVVKEEVEVGVAAEGLLVLLVVMAVMVVKEEVEVGVEVEVLRAVLVVKEVGVVVLVPLVVKEAGVEVPPVLLAVKVGLEVLPVPLVPPDRTEEAVEVGSAVELCYPCKLSQRSIVRVLFSSFASEYIKLTV